MPELPQPDGTVKDVSVNASMRTDNIPVETRTFATCENHAINVAIDEAIYIITGEERHSPIQIYGDMRAWFRSLCVDESELWLNHVSNDSLQLDTRHGFGGQNTPFLAQAVLSTALHYIRWLTLLTMNDFTCYDVVTDTEQPPGFLADQIMSTNQVAQNSDSCSQGP